MLSTSYFSKISWSGNTFSIPLDADDLKIALSAIFERLTPSDGTSIVAGVLNKLFPQKSGETPRAEDAGRGASPLDSHVLELKTTTPRNSVMADTPTKNNLSNDVEIKGSIKFANEF